ncbi:hypothetical protein A2Y83_05250 [Candidatus Falkowbacteria bacterium RBG_13_39_14]|uniref:Uncharacterized protein n=1 Tax=Candidatus Falkowbacteria bacterium RBG_13_39_14 TaxID=1797985 RepID=A0A1F5S4Z2_9BACT|nr:MAG: hypothetical protein A2Y83_05250 [Candidatus Falkowbacteria bacterium RBG_13_39_14]
MMMKFKITDGECFGERQLRVRGIRNELPILAGLEPSFILDQLTYIFRMKNGLFVNGDYDGLNENASHALIQSLINDYYDKTKFSVLKVKETLPEYSADSYFHEDGFNGAFEMPPILNRMFLNMKTLGGLEWWEVDRLLNCVYREILRSLARLEKRNR